VLIVLKCGSLALLKSSGPVKACNGTALIQSINDTKMVVLKEHSVVKRDVLMSHIIPQLNISYGTVYYFTVFEFYVPLARRCKN
jgi:hypothetical protein